MSCKTNRYKNQEESFRMYLRYLDNVKILTKEEEHDLFVEYQKIKGTDPVREKKIVSQIFDSSARFVFSLALIYEKYYGNIMDIIQEGNDGLLEAIIRFNPNLNQRLSTYSSWWIRQRILKYLSQKHGFVRLPSGMNLKINNFKRAIDYFSDKLSKTPTVEDLAKFLNISEQKVIVLYSWLNLSQIISLNIITSEDNESELQDLIEDKNSLVEDLFFKKYTQELIQEEISKLEEREQIIMKMRFGIETIDGSCTLAKVATEFNLTREGIRQIQRKAISKLKNKKILEELTC